MIKKIVEKIEWLYNEEKEQAYLKFKHRNRKGELVTGLTVPLFSSMYGKSNLEKYSILESIQATYDVIKNIWNIEPCKLYTHQDNLYKDKLDCLLSEKMWGGIFHLYETEKLKKEILVFFRYLFNSLNNIGVINKEVELKETFNSDLRFVNEITITSCTFSIVNKFEKDFRSRFSAIYGIAGFREKYEISRTSKQKTVEEFKSEQNKKWEENYNKKEKQRYATKIEYLKKYREEFIVPNIKILRSNVDNLISLISYKFVTGKPFHNQLKRFNKNLFDQSFRYKKDYKKKIYFYWDRTRFPYIQMKTNWIKVVVITQAIRTFQNQFINLKGEHILELKKIAIKHIKQTEVYENNAVFNFIVEALSYISNNVDLTQNYK